MVTSAADAEEKNKVKNEYGLAGYGTFKGKCNHCGKRGHKKNDCQQYKEEKGDKKAADDKKGVHG